MSLIVQEFDKNILTPPVQVSFRVNLTHVCILCTFLVYKSRATSSRFFLSNDIERAVHFFDSRHCIV